MMRIEWDITPKIDFNLKYNTMRQETLRGKKDRSLSATHKGEEKPTNQKGAIAVSKKDRPRHLKNESEAAPKTSTKKQQNSI